VKIFLAQSMTFINMYVLLCANFRQVFRCAIYFSFHIIWTNTDSITYEREITPDSIKEKVKIEIGEHFKDNDNFEKYLEIMKNNLTNKNELPDRKPASKDDNSPQAMMLFGNTLTLAGLALMVLKILPMML